jgi:hypothetical protein
MRYARVPAVLTWVYSACFRIPAVPIAVYLKQHGELPWFGDLFPMYGGPWSDRVSINTFIVLLMAFLLVVVAAAWASWFLWRGSMRGAVVGLVLIPVEVVFWVGFALPFPFLIGLARVALNVAFLVVRKRGITAPSS